MYHHLPNSAVTMDTAPALPPPSKSPIAIVAASSAELVSHVSKSKGKRRKKKVAKKKEYTRTETPELLNAISTVLETKPHLIQDAAALKSVLQLYFSDLNPTYSIVKQVIKLNYSNTKILLTCMTYSNTKFNQNQSANTVFAFEPDSNPVGRTTAGRAEGPRGHGPASRDDCAETCPQRQQHAQTAKCAQHKRV